MAEDYPDMAMLEGEAAATSPYSFTLPANFTPPEDYEEGKPFDAVVSVVLSNGNLTLQSINGTPLEQAEEAVEEEAEPMEDDLIEDEMAAEDGGSTLVSDLQNFRNA